jgi:hypothetical protein
VLARLFLVIGELASDHDLTVGHRKTDLQHGAGLLVWNWGYRATSLRFPLVILIMPKRLRSDSLDATTVPQIPRIFTASLKSEPPETGQTLPHHRATRGVESVPIDESADRSAVMQNTIMQLHQSGRRVIADPIVL